MELKGRLGLIAKKVSSCDIACDIGTDHAYIPIHLVLNGVCKRAVASDVRKGPLKAAKENIERYGLSDKIELRLGYGLETIPEDEADGIIIAGMGGELIKNILAEGITKAKKAAFIILQPMNSHEILREWLYDNGFDIYDEEMVEDGGKIYSVMSVRWTGNRLKMDPISLYIGAKLIEKRDPLLKPYIDKKIMQMDKAINELLKSGERNRDILNRYVWQRDELKRISGMLDEKTLG
ncbi:hypothetical protein CDQ84_05020 [Clostridium thermosuccinogenes]|jgi:tRNA (adenine22-N1)-methyltransferase|uniref:SAM-dependent methyltransferase n=1 Tax=Clostridium thermosuccinogenes TaxID=84032 RepID=A0A2K2FI95_9CLOT|nr:class I SAM-dependent methyltransferase [Pseudoclostridium thermosuccinogenes]AUS96292.1 hypothetical protein CDO33_07520 [Pseudoclostridium thermosuccinogenes]PNT93036.1 hypothetical protein CDQ83_05685 [Pseudoclostridium thermosuccinogenes]PNT98506.1 hypothetical protein CDQ85_04925 [Pseudoclostridium thermosuccinogenes]PNU00608.1 hypothetical protein CDQ84_05020 [Pseudoclostridium thermosuccinogenes]